MLQLSRSPLQRYKVAVITIFLSLLLLPLWGTKTPFLGLLGVLKPPKKYLTNKAKYA
ncbi:MAG: hypothetical protein AB1589_31975 [Cyanobacteriota bacterium]